jgi:hypothetical protein
MLSCAITGSKSHVEIHSLLRCLDAETHFELRIGAELQAVQYYYGGRPIN